MRSALLCVFITLIIPKERIHAQDDFRPMPIPLEEWHYDRRGGRAGTLHETFRTESPPSIAAVPAHYWEDALRHSVYLTLVRDKIDQLIAKGEVLSPNSKPGSYDSKEIDDHDLWDKIKTAPFDRIQDEEPGSFGDVTIMAKGRLLEDVNGFRFTEDERTKEKCNDDNCMRGVKAFWSVKRVRQRDMETSPGKYHYELTFSVISQMPKRIRKPYENPIRTFTVKEDSPNSTPQEHHKFGYMQAQTARPERAIWFHKNIAPTKQTGRKHFHGLDRIFSSFFSDDEEKTHNSPSIKYKQGPFVTQATPLYSNNKIGNVGFFNDQYQQIPFPFKPHSIKNVRPPIQAPLINPVNQPYLDTGLITTSNNNQHYPYSYDHRVESSQTVKTTRPAVLPTPLPEKSSVGEVTNVMSIESMDNTSSAPDTAKTLKTYSKYKPTPVKVNYFSDHVRPPIYSAPPGVFVTMDKKPFKPMPPLKLIHSSKPHRTNKPIDFRPSPQIDVKSTDSFTDGVFRPIMMNFDNDMNGFEQMEQAETTKKTEKIRKSTSTGKKPSNKYENKKSHRTTTATPDIITVQSSSEKEIETMDWANILGAFTKTTPMISQTEKIQIPETTTPITITTSATTTIKKTSTTTKAQPELTISTTAKPKKRTRPPPKFEKQDKIKKHKRITTTSTPTSPTNEPENAITKRPSHDLTPQASSAATGVAKSTKFYRDLNNKTHTTSSTSTTTTMSTKATTTKAITTTTQTPTTTTTKKIMTSTTGSRSKNRFRQSTLILKGTSVKHDKWNAIQKNYSNQPITTPASMNMYRRKGSNFHGYLSSTTPRQIDEEKQKEKESHLDRKQSISTELSSITTSQPNPNYDETDEQYETNSILPLENSDENDEDGKNNSSDYEDEAKDHSEFIFQPTLATQTSVEIISTPHSMTKNKTKCKKKQPNISTTGKPNEVKSETYGLTTRPITTITTTSTPTDTPTPNDILQEFLNFDLDEDNDKDVRQNSNVDLQKEESVNHESFLKIDDFEDFLDVHLTGSKNKQTYDDEYSSEDDDEEGDDNENDNEEYDNSKISPIDNEQSQSDDDKEREESNRHTKKKTAKEKRPYSLFELMAMS